MARQQTSALLQILGVEPAIACDGAEAVQLASEQDFDIILMDVMMPVMDGLDATTHIRKFEREHPSRPRVPVVAYSSSKVTSDKALMRRIGMNAVLNKPCDVTELGECLQRWCAVTGASIRPAPSTG